VGQRTSLDAVEKRKIYCPWGNQTQTEKWSNAVASCMIRGPHVLDGMLHIYAYLFLVYLKLLSVLLIIWSDNKLWILWMWKEMVLPHSIYYTVVCQEGWGKSGKSSANMADVPADIHTKHLPNKHRSVTTWFNILGDLIFLQALTFCGSIVVKALCYETRWGEYIFFSLPNPSACTRPWGSLSL
jgi:hypothetical protein